MNLEAKIAHLANLTTLMDYFYGLGGGTPNKWIAKEFAFLSEEVENELKDKHDESRKRNDNPERPEEGTDLFGGGPGDSSKGRDRNSGRARPA